MTDQRNALLVEDNSELADLVATYLQDLGYYVKYCANAKDALVALTLEDVDLLVSDIRLGSAMDGFELASAARSEQPALPILLITGYPSEAARSQSAFPVLLKPFDFADMQKAITAL